MGQLGRPWWLGFPIRYPFNQGAEYKPAKIGMQLHELDALLVMEGAKAELVFKDGCEQTLQGPQMLNIGADSVCASPSSDIVAERGRSVRGEHG